MIDCALSNKEGSFRVVLIMQAKGETDDSLIEAFAR